MKKTLILLLALLMAVSPLATIAEEIEVVPFDDSEEIVTVEEEALEGGEPSPDACYEEEIVEAPTDEEIAALEEIPIDAEELQGRAAEKLTLTKNTKKTMNVGDTLQLQLEGATIAKVKSKKAKVAAVTAAGLVSALAEGTTKITVTGSNKKKLTLTVTVVDPYKPSGVKFAEKEITLSVGEALTLEPVLSPSTAKTVFTWKSSKGKVATVSASGVVKALTEGSTKVTVQTSNKKKATVKIKVVDPYKPDSVKFEKSSITMNVGDSLTLEPILTPSTAKTAYTWKSNKAKIVSVSSSGVVKALAEGTAKITVQTSNKKKATVSITVVNPNKATGISLNAKSLSLEPGATYQLKAVLSPSTAVETLTWKSSSAKVAKVDSNGLITAVGGGTAKITVTTGGKVKATVSVKVAYNMSSSRYKYFRKYMSEKEFAEAYKIASKIADQIRDEPLENQLYYIAYILRVWFENGMEYSMKAKHYNDPYGYLVLGKASCAGCVRTTGFILNILGVSYEHVNENKYSHQWARVKVGNEYWICDAFGLYCGPEPGVRQHPWM